MLFRSVSQSRYEQYLKEKRRLEQQKTEAVTNLRKLELDYAEATRTFQDGDIVSVSSGFKCKITGVAGVNSRLEVIYNSTIIKKDGTESARTKEIHAWDNPVKI